MVDRGSSGQIFGHIRELFERENVKLAHREVTVRIADHKAGKPLSEAEKQAAASARSPLHDPGATQQ